MEKHQEYAYKEAIEEYRAVSHARITKVSDGDPNTIAGVLPRRQISNYFVQFRKVLPFLLIFFVNLFYFFDIILIDHIFHVYFRLPIIHYW
jgi:hypothetical protein